MWEKGWLTPKTELFMWRQLCAAFQVDQLFMVPKLLRERTSVTQFDTMDDALAAACGETIFLEPKEGDDMATFEHPENAVYVLGNAWMGNAQREGRKVRIVTQKPVDMFAINAASIALYDRSVKHVY